MQQTLLLLHTEKKNIFNLYEPVWQVSQKKCADLQIDVRKDYSVWSFFSDMEKYRFSNTL